jgi:haloalkane dehalogenase
MNDVQTKWFKCDDAELAWSEVGSGPAVLFIHGWPMHAQTWRHLIPLMAPTHRLVMVDLAGLGQSRFTANTDMRFESHALRLKAFVDQHLVGEFACLASDTGGTIARHLASRVSRMTHLLLLNTEIPGHRPPWIRLFQKLFAMPGGGMGLSLMARTPVLVRSSMGFGGTLKDLRLLHGEFHDLFIAPLQISGAYRAGVMQYLRGIRWSTVDALEQLHPTLKCRVRLVWGADDPTFPVARAHLMKAQFSPPAKLHEIADSRLLVHEERPKEVAREALIFFAERG